MKLAQQPAAVVARPDGPGAVAPRIADDPPIASAAQVEADAQGVAGGSRTRQLLRGSLFGLLLKAAGVLLAFASQLVLAHALGVVEFGVYVTVIAWVTVLSVLGGAGMPLSAVRFLSVYAERQNWPQYRGFLREALRLTLLTSVAIGALVLAGFALAPALRPTLGAMSLGVPLILLLCVSGLASAIFLSAQMPLRAEGLGNVSRPLLVACLVGGLGWLGAPVVAEHAVGLTVLAGLAVLAVQAVGLRPVLAAVWRGPVVVADRRAWLASGAAFLVASAAFALIERLDTILLSALVSPAAAGPYSVASRLAMMVSVALAPVIALIGPLGAQLLARGDRAGLQLVLRQGALLSSAIGIFLGGGLVLVAPLLLRLFGPGFGEARDVLVVLAATQIVLAMTGPAGYILAMAGLNRLLVATMLGTAVLDLVLCLVLISRFGAIGAALSTAIALSANCMTLAVIAWWKLRVDTTLIGGLALLLRGRVRAA